jgi:AraC-like DNA-binding protein
LDLFQYKPITKPIDIAYREHYHPIEMLSHHHNDYEIIFIVEGQTEFTIGNKTYQAGENSLLFIDNVETHEYRVLKYPYKRYVIMMKPHFIHSTINNPLLASILHHRPADFSHLIGLDSNSASLILSTFTLMLKEFKEEKPLWETSIEFLLYQMLISLYRISVDYFPLYKYTNSDDHKYKTIIEIQKHIESNFAQDLNLAELSQQFHIDRYYLCHLFKEITGYTFKSYLLLQRISKAKELLYHTNESITDIGFKLGFNNVSHFIRTFKKYVGTTPYQYKKEHKGSNNS